MAFTRNVYHFGNSITQNKAAIFGGYCYTRLIISLSGRPVKRLELTKIMLPAPCAFHINAHSIDFKLRNNITTLWA